MKTSLRSLPGFPYLLGQQSQTTDGGQQKWPPTPTVMKIGLPKSPRENPCLGVTPVPQVLKAFHLTSMGSCPQRRALLLTPSMSAAKPCRDRAAKGLPTRFLASCPLLKMGRRLAQRIITYYLRDHRTWTNMKSILGKQKKQTQAPRSSHYLLPVVWPLPQKSWPPEWKWMWVTMGSANTYPTWFLRKYGGHGSTEVTRNRWLPVSSLRFVEQYQVAEMKLVDSALMRKALSSYEVLLCWEPLIYQHRRKSLWFKDVLGGGKNGELLHLTTLYTYV